MTGFVTSILLCLHTIHPVIQHSWHVVRQVSVMGEVIFCTDLNHYLLTHLTESVISTVQWPSPSHQQVLLLALALLSPSQGLVEGAPVCFCSDVSSFFPHIQKHHTLWYYIFRKTPSSLTFCLLRGEASPNIPNHVLAFQACWIPLYRTRYLWYGES